MNPENVNLNFTFGPIWINFTLRIFREEQLDISNPHDQTLEFLKRWWQRGLQNHGPEEHQSYVLIQSNRFPRKSMFRVRHNTEGWCPQNMAYFKLLFQLMLYMLYLRVLPIIFKSERFKMVLLVKIFHSPYRLHVPPSFLLQM